MSKNKIVLTEKLDSIRFVYPNQGAHLISRSNYNLECNLCKTKCYVLTVFYDIDLFRSTEVCNVCAEKRFKINFWGIE